MCAGGMPYIIQKLSMRDYNFALDFMWMRGLHKKLWVSKMARIPISGIAELLIWESQEKHHLNATLVCYREYYKGVSGGLPQVRTMVNCESMYVRGLSVHQKCSNYALTDLLFGLCRSIWIIDPLVTCHLFYSPS